MQRYTEKLLIIVITRPRLKNREGGTVELGGTMLERERIVHVMQKVPDCLGTDNAMLGWIEKKINAREK